MIADQIIAITAGYISVPIASLINKRAWPPEARFIIALVLAGLSAAVASIAAGTGLEQALELFPVAFAAQQVTFNLSLPGAGSGRLNNRLEAVGSGTDG
jgi:hypothetical protein